MDLREVKLEEFTEPNLNSIFIILFQSIHENFTLFDYKDISTMNIFKWAFSTTTSNVFMNFVNYISYF